MCQIIQFIRDSLPPAARIQITSPQLKPRAWATRGRHCRATGVVSRRQAECVAGADTEGLVFAEPTKRIQLYHSWCDQAFDGLRAPRALAVEAVHPLTYLNTLSRRGGSGD